MVCIDNYGNLVTYEDGYNTSELYHHGILGQRWGRKNGPPYPLGAGDHSTSEKKAGWRKSLANVAKATGSGVARGVRATARGVGKGVVGTAKGVAAVAKGTKKALIRVNLYPKQLMSDQDIVEKLNRMDMEAAIKRARGKMTAEDKLNLKLKKKDARRELAKNVLGQLIPAIGKDLIIRAINDRRAAKLEIKKKEAFTELENDSKRLQKELENDSKRLQTELDIKKSTAKTDNDIREHRETADIDAQNARKAKMYEYEDKIRDQMLRDLVTDEKKSVTSTRNGKTITRSEASDMIKNLNSDYGVFNTERHAREAEEARQRKNAEVVAKRKATMEANAQKQAEAQRRLDAKNEAASARESFNAWATKRQRDVYIKVKNQSMDNVAKLGGTVLNFSGGKITYENKFGRTETIDVGNAAERIFEQERRERLIRDSKSAFGG